MPANTQPMIQAEDMAEATTTVEMINWRYKVENWWMRRQKCLQKSEDQQERQREINAVRPKNPSPFPIFVVFRCPKNH